MNHAWLKQAAFEALTVDPSPVRERVRGWERDGATGEQALFARARDHHATRAALHGFTAGLVPGLAGSLLVGLLDARGVARERATFAATCAFIRDRTFFDDPGYPFAIAKSLDSGDLVVEIPPGPDRWERTAVAFHAKELASRMLRRGALRWLGKRFGGGAPALLMPLVGGAVGAAWNYVELRWVASRFVDDFAGRDGRAPQDAQGRQRAATSAQAGVWSTV